MTGSFSASVGRHSGVLKGLRLYSASCIGILRAKLETTKRIWERSSKEPCKRGDLPQKYNVPIAVPIHGFHCKKIPLCTTNNLSPQRGSLQKSPFWGQVATAGEIFTVNDSGGQGEVQYYVPMACYALTSNLGLPLGFLC